MTKNRGGFRNAETYRINLPPSSNKSECPWEHVSTINRHTLRQFLKCFVFHWKTTSMVKTMQESEAYSAETLGN